MAEQKIEAQIQGGDKAVNIGDDIAIDFFYNTDTGVTSSGIDFQAFFNSNELRFNSLIVNTAAGGPPFTEENSNDSTDSDGNADTDKFIDYSISDTAINFPLTQPISLYTATFKVLPGFDGNTSIGFIGTAGRDSSNTDFTFTSTPLDLTADQPVRVRRGQRIDDITVLENADDTVIDLTTVFEDPDGDVITYSVENKIPSLVNPRIEGTNLILDYQEGQFGISEITVNAEAGGTIEDTDFVLTVTDDPATSNFNLDVDGSGAVTFAKDGLLTSAFLFFNTPDRTDYNKVLNKFILDAAATRTTGNDVANYLKSSLASLDADGSGEVIFARDGLLISAFLFFNTPDRTDYSVLDKFILDAAATRTTGNEVAEYLKTLLPPATAALNSDNTNLTNSSNFIGTIDNDILIGDAGNNILFGDAGDDLLTGGLGSDTFRFAANSGDDMIADFRIGEDLIAIDSDFGFSNGSEVFAAIVSNEVIDGQFSSELNFGANGTVTILHDRALTTDNFAVI
jgi:hypothetical protein